MDRRLLEIEARLDALESDVLRAVAEFLGEKAPEPYPTLESDPGRFLLYTEAGRERLVEMMMATLRRRLNDDLSKESSARLLDHPVHA